MIITERSFIINHPFVAIFQADFMTRIVIRFVALMEEFLEQVTDNALTFLVKEPTRN